MNGNKVTVVPMHEHTRAALRNFYLPYSRRLARRLNDPRFEWGDERARNVTRNMQRGHARSLRPTSMEQVVRELRN